MPQLPSGTVTFLFSDIEGSTHLWDPVPDAMRLALERHDALVRTAIEVNGGYVVKTTGDGVHAYKPGSTRPSPASLRTRPMSRSTEVKSSRW
jgi:class 3 adenylate cyclase